MDWTFLKDLPSRRLLRMREIRGEREREREISIGTLGYMEDLLQMYDTGLHRANKFFTMNELITCHIINKEMAKMIRIRHTPQPGSSPT